MRLARFRAISTTSDSHETLQELRNNVLVTLSTNCARFRGCGALGKTPQSYQMMAHGENVIMAHDYSPIKWIFDTPYPRFIEYNTRLVFAHNKSKHRVKEFIWYLIWLKRASARGNPKPSLKCTPN